MNNWEKVGLFVISPLRVWTAVVIVIPYVATIAIGSSGMLSHTGILALNTVGGFCVLFLGPLAALAAIAPSFVTRKEVVWRNGDGKTHFEIDDTWKETSLPLPVLTSIRRVKRARSASGW